MGDDVITQGEKINEIARELATRQRIYPTWIATGKISEDAARHRIDALRAIANDYDPEQMPELTDATPAVQISAVVWQNTMATLETIAKQTGPAATLATRALDNIRAGKMIK